LTAAGVCLNSQAWKYISLRSRKAQLSKIASTTGTDAEQLVKNAALRLLQEETRFVDAVKVGETQLDRGEYLTHEEVGENIERLFRS
jgi:predicted transcriptional regulator